MASSREAFLRFSKWKKDSTLLNFTETTLDGASNTVRGEIYHADLATGIVGFSTRRPRAHRELDFSDVSFEVTPKSVKAVAAALGEFLIEESSLQ